MSSSPRPESTLLVAYSVKPLTWSSVIVGGNDSSWRAVITSTSALPRRGRTPPGARRPGRPGARPVRRASRAPRATAAKFGIGEVGAEGHEAGGLHLELDEAERAVVEHDDLHREVELLEGDEVAEHHRQAAVAGERDDLPAGLRRLHADGLRHGVRHAPVAERADEASPAVHAEVARRPDHRRADIGDEHRVRVGELVDRLGHELRVERRPVPVVDRPSRRGSARSRR